MKQSSFLIDTYVLTKRSVQTTLLNPFTYIPNLAISLFFILAFTGGLSGITDLPAFAGMDYLQFVLPMGIVSVTIFGASGAGQALVKDINNGYFSRLLLTPISRSAIVLGPMLASLLIVIVQTVLILIVAGLMGLQITAGFWGLLVILLFASGWGLAFAGYSVRIALRTKNAQATEAGRFVFFPLLFLSTTFVPFELIESTWMRVAATINPTTYIFEGMRTILVDGWVWTPIFYGVIAIVIIGMITLTFSIMSARHAVKRS